MTRVLALNGSPRGVRSNTAAILTPFLEGAREAGARVETLIVRDLDIGFCQGCFTCWTSTPGVCCQKDDMAGILDKFQVADYAVFATPLYHYGMAAKLKALLERTLPLLDPHLVRRGRVTTHDPRKGVRFPRLVLVSNCGFPERDHFRSLVEQFRQLTEGRGPAATILVPAGEALGRRYSPGGPFDWFYKALHRAGAELVKEGRLSPETQEILARPLVPPEVYNEAANRSFDSTLT
ncbi:MAG TPA: flavodoxin family protein [Clostridiales bacterium]|nr:flavodoxin family protein [Clostridiales bacterium]